MTWTNAFDIGPCTVQVHEAGSNGNGPVAFSGVLGKGQSSPPFSIGADTLTVSVTSSGAVIVESSYRYRSIGVVRVIPGYPLTGYGARVVDAVLLYPGSSPSAFSHWDAVGTYPGVDGASEVALTAGVGGACTPNPADLSSNPIVSEASLFIGVFG